MCIRDRPVCSVRHLAYSTFTVLDIRGRQALLYQFDNPDAILIRNGKVTAYPYSTFTLKEKVIHESTFDLREDDMLILMSDGVTNAGMGKTTDGGWGRNEVLRFCQKKYRPGMSAQEMAVAIAYAGLALNLEETDDDLTVLALRFCKKQTVNLMIGPPHTTEEDTCLLYTSHAPWESYSVLPWRSGDRPGCISHRGCTDPPESGPDG